MKYCYKCGTQLNDDVRFCFSCGQSQFSEQQSYNNKNLDSLLNKLSERIKINSIIWIVIATLQIALGTFSNFFILIVGILNLLTSIQDIKYSHQILKKPINIIARMSPIVRPLIILIYNLIIGGLIGVAGSIYYFLAVRQLVIENKNYFLTLENNYLNANN